MTKTTYKPVRSPEYKARRATKQRARYLQSIGGTHSISAKSILLALIAEKAATTEGFSTFDAGEDRMYAGKLCSEKVAAGELHKIRLNRHVFYFATHVAAQARRDDYRQTDAVGPKKRRVRAITPQGKVVRERMAALSLRPQGLQARDIRSGDTKIFENVVGDWVESGQLIKIKPFGERLRYFANQALATEFLRTWVWPVMVRPERLEPVKAYRPVPAAPSNVFMGTIKNQVKGQVTIRPPCNSKVQVEIIYPERYARSSRLMGPGRYAVDVPFVRMGSAEWRAGVGSTA